MEQAAARLGLTPRKFRDHAAQHGLPNRKEAETVKKPAAKKQAMPPGAVQRPAKTAGLDTRPLSPVDRPDLLHQALAAA